MVPAQVKGNCSLFERIIHTFIQHVFCSTQKRWSHALCWFIHTRMHGWAQRELVSGDGHFLVNVQVQTRKKAMQVALKRRRKNLKFQNAQFVVPSTALLWFSQINLSEKPEPKLLHLIRARYNCLYNPVAPSSLIRTVWEFLQQNNINNNIKIIIHIDIPFFSRRKLLRKPTCVYACFSVCLVDSATNLTWGEVT